MNSNIARKEKALKEFFKDVRNMVRDMPQAFKWVLVGVLVITICLAFRYTVKMCYNKDKVKIVFLPIIGIAILVAVTVFLCVA